jgi:dihydrofolate reductase
MLAIIVAMDKNRLIGNDNKLPWHLPADLQYFKKITTNYPVIMGRKTFDSIFAMLGKPLPNRENIILSRDKNLQIDGCKVINNITEIKNLDNAFVIGGSNIYQQTIDIVDKLYITEVSGDFKGDAYFPEFDTNIWQLENSQKHNKNEINKYDYEFKIWTKTTNNN